MATTASSTVRPSLTDETGSRRLQIFVWIIILSTKIPTSSLGGCRDILLAKVEAWLISHSLRILLGTSFQSLEVFVLFYHICKQAYIWRAILTTCHLVLSWKLPNSASAFLVDLVRSAGYLSTVIYAYNSVETTSLVRYSLLLTCLPVTVGILTLWTANKTFTDLMIVIRDFTIRTRTTSLPILNFSLRAATYLYSLAKMFYQGVQRMRYRDRAENRPQHWGRPYTYNALDAESHIRLLRISQKSFFGEYQCSIVHTSLAGAPPYEAISYTWRDLPNDQKLYVDGWVLPVTQGIVDVIDARASRVNQTLLWIDSVCINQADPFEKATQVQLMRNIYLEAKIVIAWLGPAPDADDCVRFLTGCAVLKRSKATKEEFMGIGLNKAVRRAFFNFLSHPYWERAWIIQEIVVAPKVTIAYGHNYFDWHLLEEAVHLITQDVSKFTGDFAVDPETSAIVGSRQVSVIGRLRKTFDAQNVRTSLDEILTLSSYSKATDPRDKVYAVLGLTASANEPSIKPDYIKTKSQLCVDVARYLCKLHLTGVLSKAGLGHRRSDLSLPSWVPDYTESAVTMQVLPDHVSALEHTAFPTCIAKTVVKLDPHLPVLMTHGLIFDSIHRLGPVYHSPVNPSGRPPSFDRPEHANTIIEIDAWARSNMPLSRPHNHNNETFDESLWRTMVGNACCEGGRRMRPAPADFGAHYRNLILQHHQLFSGNTEVSEMEGIFNSWWDSYSNLVNSITAVAQGRRIAITKNGALAWVPQESLQGDQIGAVSGVQSCIALRKEIMPQSSASGSEFDNAVGNWRYVGECYVHGFMNGQALHIGTWHKLYLW